MGRRSKFSDEVRERSVRMVKRDRGGARLALGGDAVGSGEDRMQPRSTAQVGDASRDRPRQARGGDEQRARAHEAVGAGGTRPQARQRDPAEGFGVFRTVGARPPTQVMVDFIEEHRGVYGVEPICAVLPIARPRTTRIARAAATRPFGKARGALRPLRASHRADPDRPTRNRGRKRLRQRDAAAAQGHADAGARVRRRHAKDGGPALRRLRRRGAETGCV